MSSISRIRTELARMFGPAHAAPKLACFFVQTRGRPVGPSLPSESTISQVVRRTQSIKVLKRDVFADLIYPIQRVDTYLLVLARQTSTMCVCAPTSSIYTPVWLALARY